jgi:hypothetical protein
MHAMLKRYLALKDAIAACDFPAATLLLIPSATDHQRVVELTANLNKFEVVSKGLQSESNPMDLSEVRIVFDGKNITFNFYFHSAL